jgi:hypothetical protein
LSLEAPIPQRYRSRPQLDRRKRAMEHPDFWPDIRRFLLGFAGGGMIIGIYTLISVRPVP